MDYWCDWALCYRTEEAFLGLAEGLPGATVSLSWRDEYFEWCASYFTGFGIPPRMVVSFASTSGLLCVSVTSATVSSFSGGEKGFAFLPAPESLPC